MNREMASVFCVLLFCIAGSAQTAVHIPKSDVGSLSGVQASIRAAFKAVQKPFDLMVGQLIQNTLKDSQKIEREKQERKEVFDKIAKRVKSYMQLQKERRVRIQELRNKIVYPRYTIQSKGEESLAQMETELSALCSHPRLIFLGTHEEERISFDSNLVNIDPKSAQEDLVVPGLISLPGNPNHEPSLDQNAAEPDSVECDWGPIESAKASQEAKQSWNHRGLQWHRWVGADGRRDFNRAFLSDPLIVRWLNLAEYGGDKMKILDVGCGNGYLSRNLAKSGATVRGVDSARSLVKVAKRLSREMNNPRFDCDTASRLSTVSWDDAGAVVMNYVLQDCAHLQQCVQQLHRVLGIGGKAIIIIPHPCFPLSYKYQTKGGLSAFRWRESYFEPHKQRARLAGLKSEPITVFHRCLGDYIRAFYEAGFQLENFEEPFLTEDQKSSLPIDIFKNLNTQVPISVAFLFRKISMAKPELPSNPAHRHYPKARSCRISCHMGSSIKMRCRTAVSFVTYPVDNEFLTEDNFLPRVLERVRLWPEVTRVNILHPCFRTRYNADKGFVWLDSYFNSWTLATIFKSLHEQGILVLNLFERFSESDRCPDSIELSLTRDDSSGGLERGCSSLDSTASYHEHGDDTDADIKTPNSAEEPIPEALQ